MSRFLFGALVAAAAMVAVPASAAVTPFANFTQSSNASNIGYINSTGQFGTGTVDTNGAFALSSVNVFFNFTNSTLQQFGALNASFTLTGATTGTASEGPIDSMKVGGTFSFIYTGDTITVGDMTITAGANLLSGSFGGNQGYLYGADGSQGANATDDTKKNSTTYANNVTYSSQVLDFSATNDRSFGITMTSLLPGLTVNQDNGRFDNFAASAVGTFSSDPPPVVNSPVPEAGTWAMMVLGFGVVGGSLRTSRRTKVAVSRI